MCKRLETASNCVCEATPAEQPVTLSPAIISATLSRNFHGELSLNGNSISSPPLQCVVATLTVWFRMSLQLPASK